MASLLYLQFILWKQKLNRDKLENILVSSMYMLWNSFKSWRRNISINITTFDSFDNSANKQCKCWEDAYFHITKTLNMIFSSLTLKSVCQRWLNCLLQTLSTICDTFSKMIPLADRKEPVNDQINQANID